MTYQSLIYRERIKFLPSNSKTYPLEKRLYNNKVLGQNCMKKHQSVIALSETPYLNLGKTYSNENSQHITSYYASSK